ncbi:hypothetical protein VTO58DRAFT_101033 [Aureobasidium pullulans]|nr:hypothetical protein JADG_007906 [Aureobasidium pullulans]
MQLIISISLSLLAVSSVQASPVPTSSQGLSKRCSIFGLTPAIRCGTPENQAAQPELYDRDLLHEEKRDCSYFRAISGLCGSKQKRDCSYIQIITKQCGTGSFHLDK